MRSVREQILNAVVALLQPIPNTSVYRSREAAVARNEGLAFIVRPEDELVQNTAKDVVWREFRVLVTLIARGPVPDQVADPVLVAMHTALVADQSLGGLCARVIEEETKWDFQEADQNAVAAIVRYRFAYATPAQSLSTLS